MSEDEWKKTPNSSGFWWRGVPGEIAGHPSTDTTRNAATLTAPPFQISPTHRQIFPFRERTHDCLSSLQQ